MKVTHRFILTAGIAALTLGAGQRLAQAGTLSASYFALAENDPDAENNQGTGQMNSNVGQGLGPDGLPVVNAGSGLSDVNGSGEIEWWSPSLDSNVSVLNNPVYPTTITTPFTDNNMYTNTTVLGQNGDDGNSFLTAEFVGNFTLATDSAITIPAPCSDDDEFIYLSGGAFGNGTLIYDNGGIHGACGSPVEYNASMLSDVAAGNYTLSVFYDDREQTGAAFSIELDTLGLTAATPEPGTLALFGSALAGLGFLRRKRA